VAEVEPAPIAIDLFAERRHHQREQHDADPVQIRRDVNDPAVIEHRHHEQHHQPDPDADELPLPQARRRLGAGNLQDAEARDQQRHQQQRPVEIGQVSAVNAEHKSFED